MAKQNIPRFRERVVRIMQHGSCILHRRVNNCFQNARHGVAPALNFDIKTLFATRCCTGTSLILSYPPNAALP